LKSDAAVAACRACADCRVGEEKRYWIIEPCAAHVQQLEAAFPTVERGDLRVAHIRGGAPFVNPATMNTIIPLGGDRIVFPYQSPKTPR
jgi:hypothetical protein